MLIVETMMAAFRRLQSRWLLAGKSRYLTFGSDVHVGRGTRLWAPLGLNIGSHVYIGKQVHIEANCDIGDYCLIANRVAIIGRNDHDFTAVGFPMRYAPWIGSNRFPSPQKEVKAIIESDVWLGFGTMVLTGVTIGRGTVVAAGSVVTKDIPPYSIAAGVPAKVVAKRFEEPQTIARHEAAILGGKFAFSERGYDHCTIKPALTSSNSL
ncbi:CatB-related O-acetyltransferase [Rhodoferax mekongensis]|uniref:CatB-related O-acetyltransferase n=1 Tax=Rhodoferax mekongensis TaxID=3068341 RepID=UPI0028BE21E4|nr:CatB-related O-acetyltransferase [Rhodoferax sp. TBRC 17199]MDT7516460.1 CatB-related O-acetyltransferase [Rhodoferax sp. TBRC 17199]